VQAKSFEKVERTLTSDMAKIAEYCMRWRLKPSAPKTVSNVFHLHNKSHDRELNVSLNGQWLTHDPHPIYLCVTLDRILSYKHHLTKTAAKLRSRNNLLSKLSGSSWGANAATLHSFALALCYSVGEYCCPVWSRQCNF